MENTPRWLDLATRGLQRLSPLGVDPRLVGAAFALAVLLLAIQPLAAAATLAGALLGIAAVRRTAPAPSPSPDGQNAAPEGQPATPLRSSRAMSWRDVLDALPGPALALDGDLLVVHANAAAFDVFPAARLGGSIALASRNPALSEAMEMGLRRGERRSVQLHERVPIERRLDAAVVPLTGSAAGEPALLIVLHDVSERERLAQMRADFIANASHELRTPLAALRGFVETLQGPAKDDAAARQRFLAIMASEASRMTRLLDDLLSLSRVEMRAHIPPTAKVDVAEILTEVMEAMAPLAETSNVTLELAGPPGPHHVRGDHDEIVQALTNLVQNAIKYGRPEGKVEVTMSEVANGGRRRLRIAVKDDGPGIAAEHLPRLTERFYRVDTKSSREKGGTGLGLAIVKHIMNRHGGELRIASKLGEGSTFTVEIPMMTGNHYASPTA